DPLEAGCGIRRPEVWKLVLPAVEWRWRWAPRCSSSSRSQGSGDMPRRVNDLRGLAEVSRVLLLGGVQKHPGSRLKELAAVAGRHTTAPRVQLHVLVDEGVNCQRAEPSGNRRGAPMLYLPVDYPETNAAAD